MVEWRAYKRYSDMKRDLEKVFDKFQLQDTLGFIKTTEKPVSTLTSEQKVGLNRKGNVLFNQGDIEQARRIFVTTGYSDGLTRVADVYVTQNRELDALKLYLLAHNERKSEALLEKIASLISKLITE